MVGKKTILSSSASSQLFVGQESNPIQSEAQSEWHSIVPTSEHTHTQSRLKRQPAGENKEKDGSPKARDEVVEEDGNHHPGELVARAQPRPAAERREQTGPFRALQLALALHTRNGTGAT